MLRTRVIPTLLLRNNGLVKGVQFKDHKYVGDPINAVKIFNEKEVDELMFLDISATSNRRGPNYDLIRDIASEAFMPFGYGGGITSVEHVKKLFNIGVEKVVINSAAYANPELITESSRLAGSQSIVVSMDVKKSFLGGYEVLVKNGTVRTRNNPVEYARRMESLGAGELIVCSIDREGTSKGYDLKLLKEISQTVGIPVVASGGAGKLPDLGDAVRMAHVSAVSAGSMFVFHGRHKAVLITYPKYNQLAALFEEK
ncbi:MAG: AglZ/HisF2 family acetamidino modification protein [Desulfovibrionales bacterium]|nr:AglZ/HisF2 family acetamidino modification protein [Desulfovibrionales bacterium]